MIDSDPFTHYFCCPAINTAYLMLCVHTISNFTDILLGTQKNTVLSLKDCMVRWSRCSRGKGGSNYIITMVEDDPKSYCDSESPNGNVKEDDKS